MATDATTTTTTTTMATNETHTPNIRWWPLGVALGVGAVLQTAAMLYFGENRPYLEWACVFVIWPLSLFLLVLWWAFWSRLLWQIRGWGFVVLAVLVLLSLAVFRFDEFDGGMIPRFSLRWRPTLKDRASEFFKSVEAKRPETDTATTGTTDEAASDSLIPTAGDWPAYRGPNRDDVVVGESLRADWNSNPPKQLWKHPIGSGWGTFAVIGRRAWTLEQRGDTELCVCYEVETGRELWSHADSVRFSSPQGGVGPCSTPTVHDGKVFAQGGTGILNCLDAATGRRVWTHNTVEDAGTKNLEWGQCGSPLIVGDLVIVNPGSNDDASKDKQSAVIAYRCDTGEKVWSAGSGLGSYASPQLALLNGEQQVLIYDGVGLTARSAKTGLPTWSFGWTNMPKVNASQPLIVDNQRVLIGSGYGQGSVLLEFQPSAGSENAFVVREHWQSKQFKTKFNSAVRRGDFVYGLDDGLLTCLSLLDGKRRWKQGRYGYGQLTLVEDKLLILTEEGDVVLVSAMPDSPRELARFHAIEGKTWNHPVVSRGRLLVRNSDEAACFDLR